MQIANVMVNLGGDAGNQVQRYNVTPSEVHVLQTIHGDDAVHEIDVIDDVKRTSKEERERLVEIYKKAQPDGSNRAPAVDMLFPGVAARLYERFDEMDIPDVFYKAQRAAPRKDPLDHDGDGKKGGTAPSTEGGLKGLTVAELKTYAEEHGVELGDATKKADIIAAIELANEAPGAAQDDEEDGDGEFGDMPDTNLFK